MSFLLHFLIAFSGNIAQMCSFHYQQTINIRCNDKKKIFDDDCWADVVRRFVGPVAKLF